MGWQLLREGKGHRRNRQADITWPVCTLMELTPVLLPLGSGKGSVNGKSVRASASSTNQAVSDPNDRSSSALAEEDRQKEEEKERAIKKVLLPTSALTVASVCLAACAGSVVASTSVLPCPSLVSMPVASSFTDCTPTGF